MARVWYNNTQYDWSARATFLAAVPASAVVKETQDALRVVPLGKSTDTSNLRVKLASGTAEFDLVAPTHQAASRVRIATGTAVKAIAKPITTEVYSNYGDHSNTGYIRGYSDHDNTGYDDHTNYTKTYTKSVSFYEYSDYGYNNHTDYYASYIDGGVAYGVYTESGYNDFSQYYVQRTYSVSYTKTTSSGYDNHQNSGYAVYNNHNNNGYYYNQG